ncbi:MAG TPA: hypothetical protein VHS03_01935 [Gaiellaceae bacterium]|nr:hypothetical protein [Gaiellaceae bacterium]
MDASIGSDDLDAENEDTSALGAHGVERVSELGSARLRHDRRDRPPDDLLGRVAEDALDRLALVPDEPVGIDDRDDVRRVQHERLEALFPHPKLAKLLFEPLRERRVLEEDEDLAQDEGCDHACSEPAEEGVPLLDPSLRKRCRDQRGGDGEVRKDHSAGPTILGFDRDTIAASGRDDQECVADEPAGVDERAGRVRALSGLIHEGAVQERHGHEGSADQRREQESSPFGLAQEKDGEHDRHDDDVADRIGQADRAGERAAVRLVHGPQHEDPARHESRHGDDHAVDERPGPTGRAPPSEREREHAGHRERERGEEAGVRKRRERHRPPENEFVPRPDDLPGSPAEGRESDRDPRPAQRAVAFPGGGEADRSCAERRGRGSDVGDVDRHRGAADPEPDQYEPARGQHDRSRTRRFSPRGPEERTRAHETRYRLQPSSGRPLSSPVWG